MLRPFMRSVGPGIGDQLLLIEALGVVQGLLGCEAKDPVRVSLQAGQVVKKRGLLQLFFVSTVRIMAFPSLRQRVARSSAASFCRNRGLDAVKVNCSAGAREGSLGWIPPTVICTVQKGSGLKAAICASRSTTMARVGVITRPTASVCPYRHEKNQKVLIFFIIRTFEKSEPFHLEYSSTVCLSRKRFGFIITVW